MVHESSFLSLVDRVDTNISFVAIMNSKAFLHDRCAAGLRGRGYIIDSNLQASLGRVCSVRCGRCAVAMGRRLRCHGAGGMDAWMEGHLRKGKALNP